MNAVSWMIILFAGITSTIAALSILTIIGLVTGQAGYLVYQKLVK